MVKITHNQNVLEWLIDANVVCGMEFEECKTEEQRERLRKWDDAIWCVIREGWVN